MRTRHEIVLTGAILLFGVDFDVGLYHRSAARLRFRLRIAWYDLIWYGTRYGMYGVVWSAMVRMEWCGMEWYGMVWNGKVFPLFCLHN